MSVRNVVIQADEATTIEGILARFVSEAGVMDAFLIDRSGQLLVQHGKGSALDTVSISALAAGAFSSTAAMAQLVGEPEFSVLFHEGSKQNIHVSTVDEHSILLAIFDGQTPVGLVRLYAKEASKAVAVALREAALHPNPVAELRRPLAASEARIAFGAGASSD
jgi:predicted regulator of Ras-like GTPase activity (Roadblock/LC7/MglB family)